MKRLTTAAVIAVIALPALAAIAAEPAAPPEKPIMGVQGEAAFDAAAQRYEMASPRPFAEVAQCWRRDGEFIPLMSKFDRSQPGRLLYTLSAKGWRYERVTLQETPEGVVATIETAPNLDAGWNAMFARDRLEPLQRCLG